MWRNETNFPDENFRSWMLNQSYGKDGILTDGEIAGISFIDVSHMGIQNLKGIEVFKELKMLYCCFNELTELDVSKNTKLTSLLCYGNQMTSLNFKGCTALTNLNCYRNRLTELNVSECTKLKTLVFFENSLKEINISKCTGLTTLNCENNYLSELDLSGCPALTDLRCSSNYSLKKLDVSGCPALVRLECRGIKLRKLDVSGCPKLTMLDCASNRISSAAMGILVNSLPIIEEGGIFVRSHSSSEKNVMTETQVKAARKKGWTVYEYVLNDNVITSDQYEGCDEVLIGIDESNFPDAKFREWLLEQPFGEDGLLTDSEIAQVTEMDVRDMGIESLEGIGYFTLMEKLVCSNNEMTKLDCDGGMLSELDLRGCTALTEMTCNDNMLTALELSGCTALTELSCKDNWMTALDMSGCTALTSLNCQYNRLTSLNVSGNAALSYLECMSNQLTTLDLSQNSALKYLECRYNQLTTLDVSQNIALWSLNCDNNQLTEINIYGCTALEGIGCSNNQLTALNVSGCTALKGIDCSNNQLTALDVSGCTALVSLYCYQNRIKGEAMDALIQGLPRHYHAEIYPIHVIDENVITTAQVAAAKEKYWKVMSTGGWPYAGIDPDANDVEINETYFPDENFRSWILSQSYGADGVLTPAESAFNSRINLKDKNIRDLKGIEFFTGISELNCGNNQLTRLDLSRNKVLTEVNCSNNQLTSLDMSGCEELTTLDCSNNQLSQLDVSGCTALQSLNCYHNQIKGIAMKELVESFPNSSLTKWMRVIYNENEGNIMTKSQVAAARNKNLYPLTYNGNGWVNYHGTELLSEEYFPDANFRGWIASQPYGADGELTDEKLGSITEIDVSNNNIQSLKGIEFFTELKTLRCDNNLLAELDLSKNTKLTMLRCNNNRIAKLDLSKNTMLTTLYCNNNQMTELNMSGCSALTYLNNHSNRIKDKAMDALVEAMPTVSNKKWYVLYKGNVDEENVMTTLQVAAAKVKGWIPHYYDAENKKWSEYYGSEPEPEAIAEETTVNPAETATPGAATTDEGVTTSLDSDDEVNMEEGSVTMHTAMTTEEVSQLMESVEPGSSQFAESFKGIYFQLAAGKGKIELDIETLGNYLMSMMKGNRLVGNYAQSTRGTITIEYDIDADTWFFAYPAVSTSSGIRRANAADTEGALKVYSIRIIPEEIYDPDGIRTIGNEQLTIDDAEYYDLSGRKLAEPQKGINIIRYSDGSNKKVLIK